MEDDRRSAAPASEADLRQQIQQLQERLAFYEGFDSLIQDNVAHARELFRVAAQERAAATNDATRSASGDQEVHLRTELQAISRELTSLASSVEALSRRVSAALDEGELSAAKRETPWTPRRAAIVAHGVSSARSALSLRQYTGSLPQVSDVKAREFAGGVLLLDAMLTQPLKAEQFSEWDQSQHVQVLTNRPDVIEFLIGERQLAPVSG